MSQVTDSNESEALVKFHRFFAYVNAQYHEEDYMEAVREASFYPHMVNIANTEQARVLDLDNNLFKEMHKRGIEVPALFSHVSRAISDTFLQFASIDKDFVPSDSSWDSLHPIFQLRILMLRADEDEATFERAVSIRGLPSLPSPSSIWPLASSIISSSSLRIRAFIVDAVRNDKEEIKAALEKIKSDLERPISEDEKERLEGMRAKKEDHLRRLFRLQRLNWSSSFPGQSNIVPAE